MSASDPAPDFFAALDRAVVERDPYPHAVIDPALDPDVADALVRAMPPLDLLTAGAQGSSNQRFNLSYRAAMAADAMPAMWRGVLTEAMSQRFLARVIRLFAEDIRREYPGFERRHGALQDLVACPRWAEDWPPCGLGMEARLATNTPVLRPGPSVRRGHLDMANKLFIALLYLRLDGDDAEGGDLELMTPTRPPRFDANRDLPDDAVRTVKSIAYRRNRMVLILNTARSIHGVTPRAVTPLARHYIAIVGETKQDNFAIRFAASGGWWRRLLSRPGHR